MIEVKAKLKNVRISPKKAQLVADAIRGLDVVNALDKLQVIFKRSAPVIDKLLRSAVANAKDRYEVAETDLVVKSIMVSKGIDLKRWKPAAFGRAHPFKKHSSHIDIVLGAKEGVKIKAKEKKAAPIETVDLTKADKKPGAAPEDKKMATDSKIKDTGKQVKAPKKGGIGIKKG